MRDCTVFYDGDCPLCNIVVRFLLRKDKRAVLSFASLSGETAKEALKDEPHLLEDLDTLVFLETQNGGQQLHIRGRAVFRIAWRMGGLWKIPGLLSFLPALPFDFFYKIISRNRYKLFHSKEEIHESDHKTRFLP